MSAQDQHPPIDAVVEHTEVQTQGIRLHVVLAGPEDGPLVILLHGFPDFWYGWRHQIGPLAEAGFRVVVPDQRGINLSDKPEDIEAYSYDTLARDVIGLIEWQGRDKAHIVGHDLGGWVGWHLAMQYPDKVDRAVIVQIPHPDVIKKARAESFGMKMRSWHVSFFQVGWLPERMLTAGNHLALRKIHPDNSAESAFDPDDQAHFLRAWSQPGAVRAMVNWYRAEASPRDSDRNTRPSLLIWGNADTILPPSLVQPSLDACDDATLFSLEEAKHWPHRSQRARVTPKIIEFLKQ